MSSTLPPPPSGPPSGPPEYLDSGAGGPIPPEPRRGTSPVKKGLFAGGALVGLAAVGVGAWAAYGFFSTGPQPSEALPAKTLAYASIDLDPSGGQKIEALRTLNKFPAFKDYVGINPDDDLRKAIFDKLDAGAHCDGLDYSKDIEPWLGDRAAVAAVDVGDKNPDAVVVVQVKDADKADQGLEKLKGCASGDGADQVGWNISGDWAVIGESDAIADKVASAAKEHSLADDADFKKWTSAAGDSGVATFYAGPAAGDYLADHADGIFDFPFGLGGVQCMIDGPPLLEQSSATPAVFHSDGGGDSTCDSSGFDDSSGPQSSLGDQLEQKLRDFQGMAATVRFDDGAIELETAGDKSLGGSFLSGGGAADVVQSLPTDTGAVIGLGFKPGWFQDIVDYIAPYTGEDPDQLMSDLSDASGLDLPADAETLAGDSAALAVGSNFDPKSLDGSSDGSDIPVALKIKGDPDKIEAVLAKLRDKTDPSEVNVLESDKSGDTIVIGPDADYRSDVLKDGSLGDSKVFKDVVPDADKAQSVLFVDLDEFEKAIESAAGGDDQEFIDNLKPISGFGISGWVDGDVTHADLRLATN